MRARSHRDPPLRLTFISGISIARQPLMDAYGKRWKNACASVARRIYQSRLRK